MSLHSAKRRYDIVNLTVSLIMDKQKDVTKTGNGEWGMGNGEWEMGNGEWEIERGN